jgi:hypothetical protein
MSEKGLLLCNLIFHSYSISSHILSYLPIRSIKSSPVMITPGVLANYSETIPALIATALAVSK